MTSRTHFYYLEIFQQNYLNFKFQGKFRGTHFFETHLDKCIDTLKNYFGEDYFTIKIIKPEAHGKKPNQCWLIFLMAQSKESFGSFNAVLEIASIIHHYSQTTKGLALLDKKLRRSDRKIDEVHFPDFLFELYTGFIFQNSGIKVDPNREYWDGEIKVPIDLLCEWKGVEYLIECKRPDLNKKMVAIYGAMTDIIAIPDKWKKHTKSLSQLATINACGYIKLDKAPSSEKEINILKDRLWKELRKYVFNQDKNLVKSKGIINYSNKDLVIENYHDQTFKRYSKMMGKCGFGMIFKIVPVSSNENSIGYQFQIEFIHEKIDWTKKIIESIHDKSIQHKRTQEFKKLIMLEVEIHPLSLPITKDDIDVERIKKGFRSKKIVLLILKYSAVKTEVIRTPIVISNDNKSELHEMINQLKYKLPIDFGIPTKLIHP